ncbi:MAG: HNH endonuclease signature motif containing protein [Syntrophomonas sp.]
MKNKTPVNNNEKIRCQLAIKCPFADIGGTAWPICEHEGYNIREAAITLGYTAATIRKHQDWYYAKKIGHTWYLPRCGILINSKSSTSQSEELILSKIKARLQSDGLNSEVKGYIEAIKPIYYSEDELINTIYDKKYKFLLEAIENVNILTNDKILRLKAIVTILWDAKLILKYINQNANKLLFNCSIEDKTEIIRNQHEKIYEESIRMIHRLSKLCSLEISELKQLMEDSNPNGLSPREFADRDKDYRQLVTVCNPGNSWGFSVDALKYYKMPNPIHDIHRNFNKKYRLGITKWDLIRKEALEARGQCCENCGNTQNLQVHHSKNKFENNIEHLRILCFDCHIEAHGKRRPKVKDKFKTN